MRFRNSNPKVWISIGATLLAGFITFTVHRVYIYHPDHFATKAEVRELKTDLCKQYDAIDGKLNWLIQQHVVIKK